MRVQYSFDIHLYEEQEKSLAGAVERYNKAYVLEIAEYYKEGTRWIFKVDANFPKELTLEEIEKMKMDTIFRIGWII
ncbi:MAG: hypothetical protein WBL21_00150 [Salinimicrobium sp.]